MKKLLSVTAAIVCCLALSVGMMSCADANGLHNQLGSEITIKFVGFTSVTDGEWYVPGDFSSGNGKGSWNSLSSCATVAMKNGEGTSSAFTTTSSIVCFTMTNETWLRPWCNSDCYGNAYDADSASYCNFYVEDIPLGTTATVTVDGSTSPATITVQ